MLIQKEWNLPGNLEQLSKSMSYREYQTRLQWIEDQWNQPSRSDHYLMQIAQEVSRVLAGKKARRILLRHFRLKWSSPKEKTAKDSKSVWFQILGIKKHDR